MQPMSLARWRWAGSGSPPAPSLRWNGTAHLAALLPLALLLLLGLPQGRPAQTPQRALLLSPRRQPLPQQGPAALEASEVALEAAEALAMEEEEAEEADSLADEGVRPMTALLVGGAAKRQQHQFDDYGHMRFGKRSHGLQRAQLRQPAIPQRVRKFDDYGHMRFGRSEK